ncbi:MFS transporter [Candidatus Bathyarchaeota archaeon]|nr:MFS transporter [Candidatus Bathyarchaeota archaeon]
MIGGFTALLFLNLINSSYSTILTLIKKDLSLSYMMSGALTSFYFIGYAAGQIPWGFLTDRYGSRRIMPLSLLGTAIASIVCGWMNDVTQILVARFFAGLLGAGLFVPSVKMISQWYSSDERGAALGVLNIGGSIGLILASLLSPYLSISAGWRGVLVILGIVGALSSGIAYASLKDRVSESSRNDYDLLKAFKHSSFWILGFLQFIRLGAYYTFISWFPIFLQEEASLDLVVAGFAFSLFNISGMISNPLGGFFSDKIGEKFVMILSFGILAGFILILIQFKIRSLLYVTIFIIGWFINFVRSPMFTIIPRIYGSSAVGKLSGVQNTFASIGALTLPLMLGYVKDATCSYHLGWAILSILFLIGVVLYLLLERD